MTKKLRKNLNILRTKKAFKMKHKAFFMIFKGLSLKQEKQNFFGRWEATLILFVRLKKFAKDFRGFLHRKQNHFIVMIGH